MIKVTLLFGIHAASSPITRKMRVAIIDDNPALTSGSWLNKEEPPDPRVSTITPASIAFLQSMLFLYVFECILYQVSEI